MTSMPDEIVLRNPTEAEFRKFVAPLSIAFGRRMTDAEIENDRRTIELDRFIGALEGDTVVGCGGAHSFRLTVPGGEIGAAGITAVGVLPSHRRRGILRQMLTALVEEARERHEPAAVLWASEAAIYQRFGFGPGTQQTFLDAPKERIRFLRPAVPGGRIRIVELEEALTLFRPIYEALRTRVPGSVSRSEATWRWELLADTEWSRHDNGDKVLAVVEIDGAPRGYVIYRQRSEWDMTGPKGVVTVLELTGLDAIAEQTLWQWIFGIDLIATIRVWRGPAPHPMQLMVTEPRRLGVTLNDGMWLRIVDLRGALEARGYRGPGDLVIELTDDFCPWNQGRWRLSVPGGAIEAQGSVGPAGLADEVDLALDIGDLAAVYLGAFKFVDLAGAGRVIECRPGAASAADALFAMGRAPACTTMF